MTRLIAIALIALRIHALYPLLELHQPRETAPFELPEHEVPEENELPRPQWTSRRHAK